MSLIGPEPQSRLEELLYFESFEAVHRTLIAGTDTTVTFTQTVRMVQVANWDTANRLLVKDGAIATGTDVSAARVGIAAAASVPGKATFPIRTDSIHVRSVGASEITVLGYF